MPRCIHQWIKEHNKRIFRYIVVGMKIFRFLRYIVSAHIQLAVEKTIADSLKKLRGKKASANHSNVLQGGRTLSHYIGGSGRATLAF